MTTRDAYLTLNLLPHIGPVRVRKLREHLGSVEAIFQATESQLKSVEGIGTEAAQSIRNSADHVDLAHELEWAERLGVEILHYEDARYPEALREIYDPPLVLYVRGKIPDKWTRGVGVIGTRQVTHYGTEVAKKLSYQLAYSGVPVLSGLARGVDTYAHQGALAAKGVTWAVLGCGLDKIYPPENEALADKITEAGCLISEFPLGTSPDRQTFPMRNRIVSGMSFGVLVVEAGEGSGALITARQALEQGRQVFAVPGRIDNPQAKGCHALLKQGAKLVEGVEDILSELEFLWPREAVAVTRATPENLTAEEKKVFEAIAHDETPIDEITRKSGLLSGEVSSTLLRLEMKKLVKQLPGKVFVRTA